MTSIIVPFFLVLAVGLVLSELFRRLHLPWILALILGGFVIGPAGLDIFQPDATFEFMAELGLVFLLFMAGLETKLSHLRELGRNVAFIVLLNGGLPFLVGWGLGAYFGLEPLVALLLGAIFVSSSVAVIVPSLQATRLLRTRLGKSILIAAIIEDVISLVALSILLQQSERLTPLPLPLFYPLLFGGLILLRILIPKVERIVAREIRSERDSFEQELRLVFLILIGTVVIFQSLGLHPVIAGFFAGLVLSDTLKSERLREKLHALSYGLFIPIFFIVLGANTNLLLLASIGSAIWFSVILISSSLISKFVSGFAGGMVSHFTARQSMVLGAATIPQLSVAIAAASFGEQFGLSEELIATIVLLSIVTTLVGPILVRVFGSYTRRREILEADSMPL